MTTINVRVIRAYDVRPEEVPPLKLAGNTLKRWYEIASGGHLSLRVSAPLASAFGSADGDGPVMHQILREHVPAPKRRPVGDVGLLFCRNWRVPRDVPPTKVYGLMFDWRGADSLGEYDDMGVPREGAAVFLDAFRGRVNPRDDVVFTAIHEMGHVFNFQHDDNESFMGALGQSPNLFSAADTGNLTKAASGFSIEHEWSYLPGGANFMEVIPPRRVAGGGGDVPDAGLAEAAAPGRPRRRRRPAFELVARLAKQSYLLGEPVVLDMAVCPVDDKARRVPAELDPGYSSLRVWYETPVGERRLHRPPFRYCAVPDEGVAVTRDKPMENNPRVSWGGNGLNFTTPGTYRIWAEFSMMDGLVPTVLQSKPVDFELRFPRTDDEEEISHALRNPAVAFFVNQKGGALRKPDRAQLVKLARKASAHPAVRHARYALAASELRLGRPAQAAKWLDGLRLEQESLQAGVRRLRAKLRRRARAK